MSEPHTTLPLILIADDDPIFRDLIRMSLEQDDLRLHEVDSGKAAIECATTTMPDLVILDVQMPGMDGFSVCQQIRQLPRGEFVPILMMTGLDDVGSIAKAYEVGATDFVVKPCHGLIVHQRVRYMLRANQTMTALRHSQSRLAQAQRIAKLGGWEWISSHDCMNISDEACRILGVPPTSFVDQPLSSYLALVHHDDRELVTEAIREAVMDRTGFDLDHRIIHKDMTERIVHFQGEVHHDETGHTHHVLGTIQDLTDNRAMESKIYFLANYDSLTHLPNRELFLHRATQAITCGAGTSTSAALLVVGLDRYQHICDMYGTRIRDHSIKEMVHRLQLLLSTSTSLAQPVRTDAFILARIAEDQLALLLTMLPSVEESAKIAQEILTAFQAPFQCHDVTVTLSTNIGATIIGRDGMHADLLLHHAITALQAVKKRAQNGYQYFSESMNASIATRVTLEQDLRTAIATNQFLLYYHPQVDILSEQVTGFEALVRWQHPSRGIISPGEFIAVAEEEDLIIQLSDWVITNVVQQQWVWRKNRLGPTAVSINLSGLYFRQHQVAGRIKSLVFEQGGNPQDIELELTESVLMADVSKTAAILKELKGAGFRVAIDDFGTGYSSLAHLQQFPIDTLKIDQAFIKDLQFGKTDSPIMRAIIGMGRALKLHIIAEGVETRDQLAFLRMQGCSAYQGYLFSKPVPANQLQHLLQDQSLKEISMTSERLRNRLAG